MVQSVIDLCNSALQRVGAATILSLEDDSREARACNVAYDSNRRAELRQRRWAFALKRAVLAPDATAPAFDFDNAFTMPSDCLRVLRPNTARLDWAIEGRKILTNDGTTLNLRYIADIEDAAQFDPAFYDLLTIALAIDICEPLTQSNTKKDYLDRQYSDALKAAAKSNAFEAGPADSPEDDWLVARL